MCNNSALTSDLLIVNPNYYPPPLTQWQDWQPALLPELDLTPDGGIFEEYDELNFGVAARSMRMPSTKSLRVASAAASSSATTGASDSKSDTGVEFDKSQLTHVQITSVFVTVGMGAFLAALDQNIVTVALPSILKDLGHANLISWVVSIYTLCACAFTPLVGSLADVFGRHAMLQVC